MREVAQCLEYDRHTIFQHFPDLCQTISANYLSPILSDWENGISKKFMGLWF
jgi:hypothetical protein